MSIEPSDHSCEPDLPFSNFAGPVGELIAGGVLFPPGRPGILGELPDLEILRLIGRGSMGYVFVARHKSSQREVAVKVLRADLAIEPELRRRFLKEASRLQRLNHPNLVPVFDVAELKHTAYYTMPFFGEGSLAAKLREGQSLRSEAVLDMATQLASALEFVHRHYVVHHDVKPGNLLLDNGQVRLADFGLARALYNDSLIGPNPVSPEGTAPYMSPGVAIGETEKVQADVYSFGAVLYELLTGQPPFRAESSKEVLKLLTAGPPRPIREVNPSAHEGLSAVAERAMSRGLRQRYRSMTEVMEDLHRIREGRAPAVIAGKHRYWRPMIVSGAISVLALAAVWWHIANRPFEFRVLRTAPLPTTQQQGAPVFLKWDGDDAIDLAFLVEEELRFVMGGGGPVPSVKLRYPKGTQLFPHRITVDLNRDGLHELFLSWTDRTNACLDLVNQNGLPIRSYRFPARKSSHPQWPDTYSALSPIKVTDLDGDGQLELLAFIKSTWALRPRGLCCFDLNTGRTNWFFAIPGLPTELTTKDLDKDGRLEVILGSNSCQNGSVFEDGTDDDRAYLYVIRSNGSLAWRRELADGFADVIPVPGTGWPEDRLAVYVRRTGPLGARGDVTLFDSNLQETAKVPLGVEIISGLTARLSPVSEPTLFLTDSEGYLHCLNTNLQNIRPPLLLLSNQFTRVQLFIKTVAPLVSVEHQHLLITGLQVEDRSPSVIIGNSAEKVPVLSYNTPCLIALDAKLEPTMHLFSKASGAMPVPDLAVLPAKDSAPPSIMVAGNEVSFLQLERVPLNPVGLLSRIPFFGGGQPPRGLASSSK